MFFMRYKKQLLVITSLAGLIFFVQCSKSFDKAGVSTANENTFSQQNKKSLESDGQQIFRYDAFGDEDFWSGLLHIDKAIEGANNGGFGTGVSPNAALAVGLKVDVDALPPEVLE